MCMAYTHVRNGDDGVYARQERGGINFLQTRNQTALRVMGHLTKTCASHVRAI